MGFSPGEPGCSLDASFGDTASNSESGYTNIQARTEYFALIVTQGEGFICARQRTLRQWVEICLQSMMLFSRNHFTSSFICLESLRYACLVKVGLRFKLSKSVSFRIASKLRANPQHQLAHCSFLNLSQWAKAMQRHGTGDTRGKSRTCQWAVGTQ